MEFTLPTDSLLKLFLGGGAVLAGVSLGLLLLFDRAGPLAARRYLGLLLLAASLTILNMLLAESGLMSQYQDLYFLPLVFTFSFGPLLYLFVRGKLEPGRPFRPLDGWHFALPLLQFGFYCVVGFRSRSYKSWLWREVVAPYLQDIESVVYLVSFGAYLWYSHQLIARYRERYAWERERSRWLRQLIRVLAVMLLISTGYDLVGRLLWELREVNLYNLPWASFPKNLLAILLLYWLVFTGYLQLRPERIHQARGREPAREPPGAEHARIHALMGQDEPFRDPDLNLASLANQLGLAPGQLSQVLNQEMGKNFNDFVNGYRVKAVQDMLRDPAFAHYSLLAIGLEAGFNSKSTFNRVFKESTGESPNQFKNRVLMGVK